MKIVSVKRWVLAAIVLGVCVVPAVFINTIYGYLPLLLLAVLTGGSAFYLHLLRKKLAWCETSDLSNCLRGTRVDFSIDLENRSVLFYPFVEPFFYIADLFGNDDSVISDVVTMAPGETRTFGFDIRFDHIGTYQAGLRKIDLRDTLGLLSSTMENDHDYAISVIPRIYDIEKMYLSRTASSQSQKITVVNPMDSTDYAGVREYVMGDPIKNIHWKISARTSSYMTKMYEGYADTGICVILDFLSPDYDPDTLMCVFDSVVETGLSVASYAEKEGLESVVKYYDKHGERRQVAAYTRESLADMMDVMPAIHTGKSGKTGAALLREEANALYSKGNLAICTAAVTDELIESLSLVRDRRKHPMLFAIIPDTLDEEEQHKRKRPLHALDQLGISYYVISNQEKLEGGVLS